MIYVIIFILAVLLFILRIKEDFSPVPVPNSQPIASKIFINTPVYTDSSRQRVSIVYKTNGYEGKIILKYKTPDSKIFYYTTILVDKNNTIRSVEISNEIGRRWGFYDENNNMISNEVRF